MKSGLQCWFYVSHSVTSFISAFRPIPQTKAAENIVYGSLVTGIMNCGKAIMATITAVITLIIIVAVYLLLHVKSSYSFHFLIAGNSVLSNTPRKIPIRAIASTFHFPFSLLFPPSF